VGQHNSLWRRRELGHLGLHWLGSPAPVPPGAPNLATTVAAGLPAAHRVPAILTSVGSATW